MYKFQFREWNKIFSKGPLNKLNILIDWLIKIKNKEHIFVNCNYKLKCFSLTTKNMILWNVLQIIILIFNMLKTKIGCKNRLRIYI